MPFTEMIDEYRQAGLHTRMTRNSIRAVFMPMSFMISCLRKKKKEPFTTNTLVAAEVVDPVRL
jgi:hypothetical protein